MTVSELIDLLIAQDPHAVIVIERDDDYWQIADVDTVMLDDPSATNPVYDYDRLFSPETTEPVPNAVRICM